MAYTNNGQREKAIRHIVAQGYSSANKFLVGQFGELPATLNQDRPLEQKINFLGIGSDPNRTWHSHLTTHGYVQPSETDHRIYVNKFLLSPIGRVPGLLTTRLALARVHDAGELILEALAPAAALPGLEIGAVILTATLWSSFRYAMLSSLVKGLTPSLANVTGEEFIHSLALKGEKKSWVVRDSFRATAEEHLANKPSLITDAKRAVNALLTLMPMSYFQRDTEIMGRLFNLVAHGYQTYKAVPGDPNELYAFLLDMGIQAPDKIRIFLNRPDSHELREKFSINNSWGLVFPPAAEINIGISSYRNKAVLEMYWKDFLPAIFGEMRRLLGDSQGLERFGFDSARRDLQGTPQPLRPEPRQIEHHVSPNGTR